MRLSRSILMSGVCAAVLATCEEQPVAVPNTGSIALRILTESTNRGPVAAPAIERRLDGARLVVRKGLVTDSVDLVSDPTHTKFSGTLDGLRPGSYAVAVKGLVEGKVHYFGSTSDVVVKPGQNTVATIVFNPFQPVFADPGPPTAAARFVVHWSPVASASSYWLEWDTTASVQIAHGRSVSDTIDTIAAPTTGPYWLRVRAVNEWVPSPAGEPSDTVSILVAAPSVLESQVDVAPTSITASTGASASMITVTAKDAAGIPLRGATVTLAASGSGNTVTQPTAPTNASGVTTGSLSSTVAEVKTVTALANSLTVNQQPSVTVTAGPVSASQSTVSASPSPITACNASCTTSGRTASLITVIARDQFGNPVPGASVTLSVSGSSNTLTPASLTQTANDSGAATWTLNSSVADVETVSATANSVGITQTATVTVKVVFEVDSVEPAGNAAGVEIGATVVAHFSDGVDPATLTQTSVTVKTGGASLATTIRYDVATRTLQMAVPLLPYNLLYEVTVTTAVRDTSGRPLATARQWYFTTRTLAHIEVSPGGSLPSMARDAAGRLHVSHEPSFRYSVCGASCTSSLSWQTLALGFSSDETSLALDGAGQLHVSYHYGGAETLEYATCSSACTTTANWQTVEVDRGCCDNGMFPSIVVELPNRLHVTYEDDLFPINNITLLRYATCLAGCATAANWDTVTVDVVGPSGFGLQNRSSIAVDVYHGLHVAYYEWITRTLKYATCVSGCTDAGNWQRVVVDPTPGAGWTPSIVVDTTGRLHAAYYNSTDNSLNYATCATACTSGSNWQTLRVDQPVPVGGSSAGPSLAVDAMGRLHLSYAFGDTSHSDLKYATCAANCTVIASWHSTRIDVETGSTGLASSLLVDPAGRVHVAYSDGTNGTLGYIE